MKQHQTTIIKTSHLNIYETRIFIGLFYETKTAGPNLELHKGIC